MNSHFLQSPSWEKFLQSEGKTTFRLSGDHFSALCSLEHTPFGNYLYCPYGPALENKSALKSALKALRSLAKDVSATFIRIEPTLAFTAKEMAKYAKKSKDINPSDTWTLNLSGSETEVRALLPSRLLRYHRNASKNGITITTSTDPADVHYLVDLQRSLAHDKSISFYDEQHYINQLKSGFATLYLVRGTPDGATEPQVLAAGLVFDSKTTRYNLQGAQSASGARAHATGILTIQLILDAYNKGLKSFDFWGIAPDGAKKSHPWYGFTAFKKTFSGTPVSYSGTWDIPLNRPKYALYSIFRRANLILRKLRS